MEEMNWRQFSRCPACNAAVRCVVGKPILFHEALTEEWRQIDWSSVPRARISFLFCLYILKKGIPPLNHTLNACHIKRVQHVFLEQRHVTIQLQWELLCLHSFCCRVSMNRLFLNKKMHSWDSKEMPQSRPRFPESGVSANVRTALC